MGNGSRTGRNWIYDENGGKEKGGEIGLKAPRFGLVPDEVLEVGLDALVGGEALDQTVFFVQTFTYFVHKEMQSIISFCFVHVHI